MDRSQAARARSHGRRREWRSTPRRARGRNGMPSLHNPRSRERTGFARTARVAVSTSAGAGAGTVRTGSSALRRIFSVTEPSISRSTPDRPCVPMTMRSAGMRSDCARISSGTSCAAVVSIPPCHRPCALGSRKGAGSRALRSFAGWHLERAEADGFDIGKDRSGDRDRHDVHAVTVASWLRAIASARSKA